MISWRQVVRELPAPWLKGRELRLPLLVMIELSFLMVLSAYRAQRRIIDSVLISGGWPPAPHSSGG